MGEHFCAYFLRIVVRPVFSLSWFFLVSVYKPSVNPRKDFQQLPAYPQWNYVLLWNFSVKNNAVVLVTWILILLRVELSTQLVKLTTTFLYLKQVSFPRETGVTNKDDNNFAICTVRLTARTVQIFNRAASLPASSTDQVSETVKNYFKFVRNCSQMWSNPQYINNLVLNLCYGTYSRSMLYS